MVELLRRALTDAPSGLVLRPLPEAVADLLLELRAPARLGAHLLVVHDVACQLTAEVNRRWPTWTFDAEAVHFGAAVHDVGKVIHPGELSGPGSAHELAGWQLLIDRGLPPERARFARTHASWRLPEVEAEDLLVSLAGKIWKGHRVKDLEQTVLERIAPPCRSPGLAGLPGPGRHPRPPGRHRRNTPGVPIQLSSPDLTPTKRRPNLRHVLRPPARDNRIMRDGTPAPTWRQHVDLEQAQVALLELEPLLRGIAETGASFIIKVDGQRTEGADPPIFTAVISGTTHTMASIRFDDSDLVRAVAKAIRAFDAALGD